MQERALLDELLDFAREQSLKVRIAPFAPPGRSAGGLCVLRGRRIVLLDGGATLVEQSSALAEALVEALGEDAATTATNAVVRAALDQAASRLRWRSARDAAPRPASPLQRRISVLRGPKPGLRSVRPKR